MRTPLLKPNDNCWRVGIAEEAFVMIDAESYFASLYETLAKAERSIYILGWDIDSRQSLIPGDGAAQELPSRVGEFLDELARRNPALDIYVLCWDFSPIYLVGRESFQTLKMGWQTHARLHFHFDDQHPVSASHHQKVVVIDDQIAYCGGLDLTIARWDGMAHRPDDDRRRLPNGQRYAPFHDVQIGVVGAPAAWLGELCRERWREATGETLTPVPTAVRATDFALGPRSFAGAKVGIARTIPAFKQQREVREVEKLFVDSIAAAERYIYIENQYLTAGIVVSALTRSLSRPVGPEIILVLPKLQDNWLSQHTMGTLSSKWDPLESTCRHASLSIL